MKNYLLAAGLIAGSMTVNAQGISQKITDQDGTVKFLKFDQKESFRSTPQSIEKIFSQYLYKTSSDKLVSEKVQQDELGQTERFQQFHNGVKVEDGQYLVHTRNGQVVAINGQFKDLSQVTLSENISEEVALNAAVQFVGAEKYMWEGDASYMPKGEKVIIKGQLAYKFDVYAELPVSRANIYVSANDGSIVFENKTIKHAVTGSAQTRYSGTRSIKTGTTTGGYNLRDNSRGNGIETYDMNEGTRYTSAVDFVDNDNNWTSGEWNNTAKDNAALDAHWGAQMTYDYWMQIHSRNSYDGNGAAIKSYVHYNRAYDNAFWNGSVMTYGDGSGTYFDALTSLDVAAHEIGHAVCEKTANLVYSYESGAMNEGFSDIWGACVEAFAAPEKNIWLIGEDIERRAGSASLRSMINPNDEGQPDTYQGTMWYSGTGDNGGVHYNSGVLNHWFYRLSEGGNGTNDNGTAFSVNGIGIVDAGKIAYRLESVYLTSNSQYQDAANYGVQAAIDLFGDGSAQHTATVNAFLAVGLTPAGTGNGGGGGTPPSTGETCGSATGVSASRRAWANYTITVAAGTTSLDISTAGTNGDADLYVRFGSQPTTRKYTAVSAASGSNESVSISNPTAGTWYIGVYAYSSFSGLTVEACTTAPAGAMASETPELDFNGETFASPVVFPNPASSTLNIQLSESDNAIEIVSLTGQVVFKSENTGKPQAIDVSNLKAGVYLVIVSDDKGKHAQKFIKE